jgi:hypothetical protein
MGYSVQRVFSPTEAGQLVSMALFIPEWIKLAGSHVHVKRVLSTLSDAHVVRRPLRPLLQPLLNQPVQQPVGKNFTDFFVQHQTAHWLAVVIDETPFAELDPAQLFEADARAQFEQRLLHLQTLGYWSNPADAATDVSNTPAAAPAVEALVLMWRCSAPEVSALTKQYVGQFGVRLVSREKFMQLGAKLITSLVAAHTTALLDADVQRLLGAYFPEAEIPAACTTRRFFQRDNSAKLPRFFLDPEQEWATKLDLNTDLSLLDSDLHLLSEHAETTPDTNASPNNATQKFSTRLVNGVAGSGKTLIALNRAIFLADIFPKQRLLILIHNTPIVADIQERLHQARGCGLPANLEIQTFCKWARQQWCQVFSATPKMPDRPQLVIDCIQRLRTRWPEVKHSAAQLVEEFDFINEALIFDETQYREASRAGRGFALRPKDRSQIWALKLAVDQTLATQGMRLWSALPCEIFNAIALERTHQTAQAQRLKKYHHILVDEAQFFAPAWFQVVKLALVAGGQLFLCADPNQGFMKNRLSWKSVGLEVAGRTKKLRKSYRTTRAILEAATNVLTPLENTNRDDYLEPNFTDMAPGLRPMLIYTGTPQDSIDCLVSEIQRAAEHQPLNAMLVIYGNKTPKTGLYEQLNRRLGAGNVWWLNHKDQKQHPPRNAAHQIHHNHLRMAFLDTATGLEGSMVFLIGMEDLFFEAQLLTSDAEAHAQMQEQMRRKLYMAMTRAGQRLVLLASQKLPKAMEQLFDLVG